MLELEPDVVDAEVLEPEAVREPGFVVAPPALVQEAIAANALLEVKNSLDAVWLHSSEIALPREQSLCATYEIAIYFLERALTELGEFSAASYTPSVRGWRVVAESTLESLKEMGKPDHKSPSDLEKIAKIVTLFLGWGHKMLNQNTSNLERKKLATRLLAEMLVVDHKPKELEAHGSK